MSEYQAFGNRTKTLDQIPGCPGQTVVIRQLNGKRLGKAHLAYQAEAVQQVNSLGGNAALQVLQQIESIAGTARTPEQEAAHAKAVEEMQKNPLFGLDRDTVILEGVVNWSFREEKTAENVADMLDEVADYIAREIIFLTRPALSPVQEKNDSGPSSAD